MNFNDQEGYELLMMACFNTEHKEIRIYTNNDIDSTREGLISYKKKFLQAGGSRVPKMDKFEFDYDSHFARINITDVGIENGK